MMGNCHCRSCQRATGAPFFSVAGVPADALVVTGKPRRYEVTAASGNSVARSFCGTCGTTLFGESSGMPQMKNLSAVTLDEPGWFEPGMNIFTEDAQSWDIMDPKVAKFERMPQG